MTIWTKYGWKRLSCSKDVLLLQRVLWGTEVNHKCLGLWVRFRSAHVSHEVRSKSDQGTLTIRTKSEHSPVSVRSRSAQCPIAIHTKSYHSPDKVRSQSAQGPPTIRTKSENSPVTVRSSSAHGPTEVHSLFARSPQSGQVPLTVRNSILCLYLSASVFDRAVPWKWSLV
jgi:hypothetical protein